MREHVLSELVENRRKVTNFAFALFRVLIHSENAEDKFLVLDVALANELLETFPVLSSEVRSECTKFGYVVLLEFLVEIFLSVLFAARSDAGIKLYTTFW